MRIEEKSISYTEIQIKKLQARWTTPEGKKKRKLIQKKLESCDNNLTEFEDFESDPSIPKVEHGKDLRGIVISTSLPEGLDLSSFHLSGAKLEACNLSGVNFAYCHLEYTSFRGSTLKQTVFSGAFMTKPNFVGSDIEMINLSEAIIDGVPLISHPTFTDQGFLEFKKTYGLIDRQYIIYSILKTKYKLLGKYDEMVPFHMLEMRARRDEKHIDKKTNKKKYSWYFDFIGFDLLCGYGEKWLNCVISALAMIIFFSLTYMIAPLNLSGEPGKVTTQYIDYLLFSCVTFSNLGTQDFTSCSAAQRYIMFFESILGLVIVTMTIVIYTRKVIRE